MIVELVDPDIGDRICDPACGTAGFLINAYEYIIRKHTSPDMVTEDDEGKYYGLYDDKISDKNAWTMLWTQMAIPWTINGISLMAKVTYPISFVISENGMKLTH
jgi:type I restriction-modification system DNA methylase subunit